MANNVEALKPELWTSYMQDVLEKSLVSFAIADTTLAAELKVGDTIHVPYYNELSVSNYTPGTSITIGDVTATDDYITVTNKKVAPFYIDNVEELQIKPELIGKLSENAAYKLRDAIDQAVLAYASAAEVVLGRSGATDFVTGDTNLTAITLTTGNIVQLFSNCSKVLREKNVEDAGDWIAIIPPSVYQLIEEKVAQTGGDLGDRVLENGYGGRFMGYDLYVSNNLPQSYFYVGRKGMISLIIQQDVKMEIKDVPDKLGRNFIPWVVYGAGALHQNKKRFISVKYTV